MTKIVFCKKIEIMRSKLHDLIEQYGIDSDIVLNYSQELDKLMCEIESVDNVE
ncbi:MAG: aspartyl-phosphate phosphatase Spo0E family protein [Lutispora sp.]